MEHLMGYTSGMTYLWVRKDRMSILDRITDTAEKRGNVLPHIMFPNFDLAVSALADSIIRERCPEMDVGRPRPSPAPHDLVIRFLLDQQARMPDYLRLPLKCLTLLFDASALPFTGRLFHRLPYPQRSRQIRAWRESSLQFRRDLIKFYETLTVFGWYSYVYEKGH